MIKIYCIRRKNVKDYEDVVYIKLVKKEFEEWKKNILKKFFIFDKVLKGI